MNGGTCFIASPSRSIGSGGSTPTLLMTSGTALPPTQSPYFNIDMSKMSISRNTLVEQQRSMTEEEMRQNIATNIHIRSDSDDPKADLDALFDLSRTNRMKPMRLRKLPPSFFSYSPKTSVTEVKPLVNSSSSILTPQSPLAAHIVNHGQPPVDVKSPQIAQLQAPQRNSPAEHQQRTLKNKHFRTRSTPATLEETLAVVPPELPPSTLQHQHASPGSVPNATGVASPAGSNGPLSPLSSSSISRQQHRHQPVLLPSRHSNGMLLHGHRPLTLAPQQPNTNDEAMCVDAAEPLNTGKSSPPNKKLAHNSARPVNGLSLHERQQSLPTHQQLPTAASSGSNFMFNQTTSVPASPMLLLPPQSSQFGIVHGTHHPQPPLHFHSPSLQLSSSTAAAATSFVDNEPLPPGWEMGFTESGQKYFINHLQKTTAWEDPRLPIPAAAAAAPTIQKSPPRSNSNGLLATNKSSNEVRHVRQMSSPLLSAVNAAPIVLSLASEIELPLPHGWEKRVNEHGQVYFADNINKRTSWEDPRSIVAPEEMLPSFQQFAAAHSSNGSSSSNTSTTTTTPTPPAEAPHNLRPTNLELASSSTLVNGHRPTSDGRPPITNHTSTRSMDNSGVQQQVRMRGVLQAEREQMHIRRREMDQSNINANFPHQANLRATPLSNRPPRMVGGLNGGGGMNTMASDPFLGSNALLNSNTPQHVAVAAGLANGGNGGDFHSRQASCDSGMSSAGGCSLPQTPEGLLAQTLDELNLNQQQQQQLHMQQYNKFNSHLRSARDNSNYHYHQHYHQSSLIGNCWPPAAPQPQAPQFFHPQQNPTVHHKSASIDVGCLTAANGGASQKQRPQVSTLNGVQTPQQQPSMTFLSSEDANMLSMAEEPLSIPDDLSRIDFDDLASILNPPSPLRNSISGSHTFSLQPPNAVEFMSNSGLNILQPSSQQQQQQQQQLLHHRHQRQQAFCE